MSIQLDDLKAGDVLGFSGDAWMSAAISIATYGIPFWGISHVGIVAEVEDTDIGCYLSSCGHTAEYIGRRRRGDFAYADYSVWNDAPRTNPRMLLFESSFGSTVPCYVHGRCRDGTGARIPADVVEAYKGKVWHYPAEQAMSPIKSAILTWNLLKNCGKPYDAIGAFRSGGVGFSWFESLFRKEDLSSLFCSEYCVAALKYIGQELGSASKWNPAKMVRALMRNGYLRKPRRLK